MEKGKYERFVGIDVSKSRLDVYDSETMKWSKFANNAEGVSRLARSLGETERRLVVVDLTGGYEAECAKGLHDAGFSVALAEGRKAKAFARAAGVAAKTDRIDAKVLAEYGERFSDKLRLFEPKNADMQKVLARIADLKDILQREKNRVQAPALDSDVKADIREHIEFLEKKIRRLEKMLDDKIDGDDETKRKRDAAMSIKGIGKKTATLLVVTLKELGSANRREIAALGGVAPFANDSGSWSGHRFTRRGRQGVKKALYMCALVAVRFNAAMREFYERLLASAKSKMVALTAVMPRLLVAVNFVCKPQPVKIFHLG